MAFIHKHTHTQEWEFKRVERLNNIKMALGIIKCGHKIIAKVNNTQHEEGIYNAKLISQTPKLLEVVEMFHDFLLQQQNQGSITLITVKKLLKDCGVEIK